MNLKLQMMRQSIYSFLLVLAGLLVANTGEAAVNVDRVIEKSFPINADGTFDITNKYGNIDIVTWDQNEISIKVTISVKTGSQEKADEIFERINVNFDDQRDFVSAVTEIESKSNSWFNWGSTSSTKYQINYDVKMPASVHLKCRNKYGNTYVVDLNNGADIVMKYGNMRMGSVEGSVDLDLGYVNMEFGDIGDLKADIKYSQVKGSSTQDLNIISKYSKVDVGDVVNLKSDTKYDAYTIDKVNRIINSGKYDSWELGEVGELSLDTKYTGIAVGKLMGDLDLNQKFGSLEVENIDCTDILIDVEVEYTGVRLNTEGCGDVKIEYSGEYTDTNFAGDLRDRLEVDGKRSWLNTEFGSGKVRLILNMRYGDLKIR